MGVECLSGIACHYSSNLSTLLNDIYLTATTVSILQSAILSQLKNCLFRSTLTLGSEVVGLFFFWVRGAFRYP